MRSRKLVVRGFTCFRDEVTIDFTALDLFAITGPTGAGKTSLLDAMTFALYGRVYRVEGVRSVISLGVKEVRVYFEFSVGPAVYRVTRVGFAATRASQVALDRALGNNEWEPLAKGAREAEAKITALLGLDFEGFTKAVLLPQGAFSRFLQGEPSERRSILEALLGLEVYERIQKRANQVADARRQEVDLLGQQLARDYADVTPERVEALETAATDAGERIVELRAARDASAAALALARRVTEGRHRADGLATQAAVLDAECEALDHQVVDGDKALAHLTSAIATLDQEVKEIAYDDARHLLLGSVEGHAFRRDQILDRLGEIDVREQSRATTLATVRTDLATCHTKLAAARTALAERQQALKVAEREALALEAQYGSPAAIAVVQQTERQWRDDQRGLTALDAEIVTLEARQASLDMEGTRLRAAAAQADGTLADAESAKADAAQRAGELRELHTRVSALRGQLGDAARAAAHAQEALTEKRTHVESVERAAAEAEEHAQGASEACEHAEATLDDFRFENAAYVLRTRLRVGAPCPVCAEKVTAAPVLHAEHSLAEAQAALTRAQDRMRTTQDAAQRATKTLTRAQTELAALETAKGEVEGRLERLNEEIGALLPPDVGGSTDQLAALRNEADAAVEAAERRATVARAATTQVHTDVAQVEGELRGLPSVADKRAARADVQARCDAAAAEVARVCGQPPGEAARAALETIATKLADAATLKATAAEALTPAAAAVHELDLERERLARRVETEEQAATAATEDRERLTGGRQEIERALTTAGIVIEGDVLGAIRNELGRLTASKVVREERLAKRGELVEELTRVQEDVATLRGRRRERVQQRDAARAAGKATQAEVQSERARLAAAVAAGEWAGWDEAAAGGTEEAWLATIASETQTAYEGAVAEHTALSTEARTLAARLVHANECRARHAEAQREADVAHELGQLLMANRFRSYLLEEAIRTLAGDGTRHLQELSGGRYAFHTEGAEFQIVDGWNADERRSVKTLSGGETFLASLALALGLAEGLPALGPGEHGQQRLESLFIDEGFGTLDPDETLDIVTQALENLRTRDRIVGIVTHLPQLADRLPAQIRVVKAQVGSHIEVTSE